MSEGNKAAAGLRERLTTGTEDKIGRALVDLIENPLITGTIGRAFDARERAAQAQELALSALNIPTAADIERLTRRLRSVSQRLEGIEDGVHRINRALTEGSVERRLGRDGGAAEGAQQQAVGDEQAFHAGKLFAPPHGDRRAGRQLGQGFRVGQELGRTQEACAQACGAQALGKAQEERLKRPIRVAHPA